MDGRVGGVYGVLSAIGRKLFAVLVGQKIANDLPRPMVALVAAGSCGALIGLFFPAWEHNTVFGSVTHSPGWIVGLTIGAVLVGVLALIEHDAHSKKSK